MLPRRQQLEGTHRFHSLRYTTLGGIGCSVWCHDGMISSLRGVPARSVPGMVFHVARRPAAPTLGRVHLASYPLDRDLDRWVVVGIPAGILDIGTLSTFLHRHAVCFCSVSLGLSSCAIATLAGIAAFALRCIAAPILSVLFCVLLMSGLLSSPGCASSHG